LKTLKNSYNEKKCEIIINLEMYHEADKKGEKTKEF